MTENKKTLWQKIVKNKWAYVFILPLMIATVGFCYYPAINGIFTSLFQWNGTGEKKFIAFANYAELFSDEIFLNSIGTMFVLLVPRLLIGVFMPLIMAELIFNTRNNRMLGICEQGVTIDFLNDPNWVISTVIILGFPWVNGTNILIYISGIMSVSGEVIEASELDGCGTWRRIFTIDIPLLLGQIRYFAVFGFIGLMQDYGIQMILTNGGPGYTTYVPGWYMYRLAFTSGRYGYACSIGTVLFIAIFAVTLVAFRLMHYGPFAKQSDM